MKVEDLPIPDALKAVIQKNGIEELYPPQEDALLRTRVLKGGNLVLASPTASGKTLVAEICALKHVLEGFGKVLYLTPLRALASEKFRDFQKYEGIEKPGGGRVRMAISTGDYDSSDPWLGRFDIIVSTNEKVDSLLRHRAPWIENVSLIVSDELHYISDGERGPTLEVVLARLMQINPKLQVLALSATIRNAQEIAEWLKADYITTDWRPVKLREGVYLDGVLSFNDGHVYRCEELYGNPALNVAVRVVDKGGQVLIFTETRRSSVEMASRLAPIITKFLSKREKPRLERIAQRILNSGERTRLSEALSRLVEHGVAFHHAGLAGIHRQAIEDAFRERLLKVVCATPTLAAGVNLPARVVIINSYQRYEAGYGRYPISILEYKQMAGRAGRPRYDAFGEAILIARSKDEEEYLMESYVKAQPERLWSKLGMEKVLRSHVLSTVASGFAHSDNGIVDFFERTLYAFQYGSKNIQPLIKNIVEFLLKEGFLEYQGSRLEATAFGRRVSELYIDPISAVIIRDGLRKGSKLLTDISFLHLACHTPDMAPKFYPGRREEGSLQSFIEAHKDEFMVDLPLPEESEDSLALEEALAEVKCVRVLESWIEEVSEDGIIEKFGVEPGDLYRLLESAKWLLHAIHELSALLGRKEYLSRLERLMERVRSGVKEELLPLTRLEGIGRVRGRSLFNAGYRSLEDLRRASLTDLTRVPMIGTELAKRIKDQVGGKVSQEEMEKVRSGWMREQKLLTEYEP
ncbi:MAG: DEAD/DEAH box helicase [Candidatus Bathyarchaeia archaeon]